MICWSRSVIGVNSERLRMTSVSEDKWQCLECGTEQIVDVKEFMSKIQLLKEQDQLDPFMIKRALEE